MQFLFSELQTHRFIQKEDQFDPNPFLGPPPHLVEFASPVQACVRAELVSSAVLVSGDVSTVITCTCARCLTKFDKKIEGKFKQSFDAPEPAIDVDYYIKETVILDLPLKALCKEKCLGLCPTCGQNRNEVNCKCRSAETQSRWDALKGFRFPNNQSPSIKKRARRNNG